MDGIINDFDPTKVGAQALILSEDKMEKEDKIIICYSVICLLITFFFIGLMSAEQITYRDNVRLGENFIIENASYRCEKTNELKRGLE